MFVCWGGWVGDQKGGGGGGQTGDLSEMEA